MSKLKDHVLIPIIRTKTFLEAEALANLLVESGLKVIEITMSVPDSYKLINQLKAKYSDIIVGAGTVLEKEQVVYSMGAGAQFIVSPVIDPKIIKITKKYKVLTIPGAMTPTEILSAVNAGINAVKIFPASAFGGAFYLKAVKQIFPDIAFMPTGGIDSDNLKSYLEAGADLIGMGGNLADVKLLKEKKFDEIQDYAKRVMEIIRDFKKK
ncbi:MAG: bifunctional 4-hydroxy-2-oxoglutarate aldolase/2-dehydro-3-deoxy-phosphogluconate aldolase [Spirochaetes bacterium]|nr:bifunctional 4-hydroxy-2-oxoglutarate aldolase/2-dehydro-3-deoxy-phosphogluconate aldolase [Spirochaetota bacterium]